MYTKIVVNGYFFSREAMTLGHSAKAAVVSVVAVTVGADGAAKISAEVEAETSVQMLLGDHQPFP